MADMCSWICKRPEVRLESSALTGQDFVEIVFAGGPDGVWASRDWGSEEQSSFPSLCPPGAAPGRGLVVWLLCSRASPGGEVRETHAGLGVGMFLTHVVVKSLSSVWLLTTLWAAARQAFLPISASSWSLLKFMSIESMMSSKHCLTLCNPMDGSMPGFPAHHYLAPGVCCSSSSSMSIQLVMPSNHLILCRPLLLLPSIFLSIRVISNKSALGIRQPKYWSFSSAMWASLSSPWSVDDATGVTWVKCPDPGRHWACHGWQWLWAPSLDSTYPPDLVWVEMLAHCHAVLYRGNAGSGHTAEWPGSPSATASLPTQVLPPAWTKVPWALWPQWAAHMDCLLRSPAVLFNSASGPSPTLGQLDESSSSGAWV